MVPPPDPDEDDAELADALAALAGAAPDPVSGGSGCNTSNLFFRQVASNLKDLSTPPTKPF